MWHEERIIDGKWMVRGTPGGIWRELSGPKVDAWNALMKLSDDEKISVFSHICTNCGSIQLPCYCTRDD